MIMEEKTVQIHTPNIVNGNVAIVKSFHVFMYFCDPTSNEQWEKFFRPFFSAELVLFEFAQVSTQTRQEFNI